MKKILSIVYCLLSACILFAQDASSVTIADELRASGKIYVVVGVLVTILTGVIFYLFLIDRKVSAIEKKKK